jgi:hypothetical protein
MVAPLQLGGFAGINSGLPALYSGKVYEVNMLMVWLDILEENTNGLDENGDISQLPTRAQ